MTCTRIDIFAIVFDNSSEIKEPEKPMTAE